LPPPGIIWHCILVEPGLSSLKKNKAISHLSGTTNVLLNYKSSSNFNSIFLLYFD